MSEEEIVVKINTSHHENIKVSGDFNRLMNKIILIYKVSQLEEEELGCHSGTRTTLKREKKVNKRKL